MTDPRSELEQVIAEWRAEAVEHGFASQRAYDEGEALYLAGEEAGQRVAKLNCADRLSAILQRSPQQEEEKDEKT